MNLEEKKWVKKIYEPALTFQNYDLCHPKTPYKKHTQSLIPNNSNVEG
jgi:hypothetical protein